jgi:hypothetical protein
MRRFGNAVVIRTQVMVDSVKAKVCRERENRSPVSGGVTAGIDRHICPLASRTDGGHRAAVQPDQPADLYHQLIHMQGVIGKFGSSPRAITP